MKIEEFLFMIDDASVFIPLEQINTLLFGMQWNHFTNLIELTTLGKRRVNKKYRKTEKSDRESAI